MTWNDLINLLQEIPESRREEKAVFLVRDENDWTDMENEGTTYEIDCKEEHSLDIVEADCNTGNDETTFVLST